MSCPSGAPEFTPGFQCGPCYSIFSCMCISCGSLFVLLSFYFLAIVLSVLLRNTDSDYPFDIFKHFLMWFAQHNKFFMPTMFVWFNSITTVWFSREGSVYLSRPHELITPVCILFLLSSIFSFLCSVQIIVCLFLLFLVFSFWPLLFPFFNLQLRIAPFVSSVFYRNFPLSLLYLQAFLGMIVGLTTSYAISVYHH